MLYTMKDLFGCGITGGKCEPSFYSASIPGVDNDSMLYHVYYSPDIAPLYFDNGNYGPDSLDAEYRYIQSFDGFDLIA